MTWVSGGTAGRKLSRSANSSSLSHGLARAQIVWGYTHGAQAKWHAVVARTGRRRSGLREEWTTVNGVVGSSGTSALRKPDALRLGTVSDRELCWMLVGPVVRRIVLTRETSGRTQRE